MAVTKHQLMEDGASYCSLYIPYDHEMTMNYDTQNIANHFGIWHIAVACKKKNIYVLVSSCTAVH